MPKVYLSGSDCNLIVAGLLASERDMKARAKAEHWQPTELAASLTATVQLREKLLPFTAAYAEANHRARRAVAGRKARHG